MHLKSMLTGAILAAVLLAGSAGASLAAHSQTLRLSTRAEALTYLRSQGVDARTVVFQQGSHNYAGPSCPGKGWTCTSARHVVQFGALDNTFVCDPASDGTAAPFTCVIVQVNTTGDNNATCTETATDASDSQSCSIKQTDGSGTNTSSVDQEIDQSQGGEIGTETQQGTQAATVDQENGSGANNSTLTQSIGQGEQTIAATINQSQDGEQSASVEQNSTSGPQSSRMSQSQVQSARQGNITTDALSPFAMLVTGSQSQTGNGTATVDQHSSGVSTSDNTQSMNQNETVPKGSSVTQSQIGPFRCCSFQDTNPNDQFTLTQTKVQNSTGGRADQFAGEAGVLHTTGHGSITDSITQNGAAKGNHCAVTNGSCYVETGCSGRGTCKRCVSSRACCVLFNACPRTTATLAPPSVNGWYLNPTTVTLHATAGGDVAIVSTSYRVDGGPWNAYVNPFQVSGGGTHEVDYYSVDAHGNTEATEETTFKIDAFKPSVTVTTPGDGSVIPLGKRVLASFKCSDKQTSISSCDGSVDNGKPIDTSTVGAHTFTVVATDAAGNTTTVVTRYTVVYVWNGYFAPITNTQDAELNLVHAGDLIKIGFGLNGDQGLGIFAAGYPTAVSVDCPTTWPVHLVPAGGEGSLPGLQYGVSSGHYTYGWQTSTDWAGRCFQFESKLSDTSTTVHSATFMFFS